ncbi:MAG: hypothetical protein SWO11_18365, partial [Thermodesulfobacteriota bacterium]|nr:hypothetical protein [Thermodesulfobacteriota bacterium]
EKKAIEAHLSLKEQDLFNLGEKIILYDLTDTFFKGIGEYNKKVRFRKSKEKLQSYPHSNNYYYL